MSTQSSSQSSPYNDNILGRGTRGRVIEVVVEKNEARGTSCD